VPFVWNVVRSYRYGEVAEVDERLRAENHITFTGKTVPGPDAP
jgi:hypothetical protein